MNNDHLRIGTKGSVTAMQLAVFVQFTLLTCFISAIWPNSGTVFPNLKFPTFRLHEIQVQVSIIVPAALRQIGFNDQLDRFGLREKLCAFIALEHIHPIECRN